MARRWLDRLTEAWRWDVLPFMAKWLIAFQIWRYGFWIRVFGVGISIRKDEMVFSERNGYVPAVSICGWVIKPLKRWRG
jgi:hypothetical protein